MSFYGRVIEFFNGDKEVTALATVVACLLLLSFIIGYFLRSAGLFAAFASSWLGGACLIGVFRKVSVGGLVKLIALGGIATGVAYALSFWWIALRRMAAERKSRRKEEGRRLKFVLPDRDNAYVRARLNTTLQTESKEFDLDKESAGVRLEYAQKMLAKVREVGLSPIERLDVEEMSGLVALYTKKERWSGSDMRALNEVFARLLKLSAKYEVTV